MLIIDHRWEPRRLAIYEQSGLIDNKYASFHA